MLKAKTCTASSPFILTHLPGLTKLATLIFCSFLLSVISRAEMKYYVDSSWNGPQLGQPLKPWKSLTPAAWSTINSTLATNDVQIYFSAKKSDVEQGDIYDSNLDGVQDGIELTKRTANTAFKLRFDGNSYYNASELTPYWILNPTPVMSVVKYFNAQHSDHAKRSNIQIKGFRIITDTNTKFVTIAGDNWIVEQCEMSHTSAVANGPGIMVVPTADAAHGGSGYYTVPCTNIVIINNIVHDTYGEAIYIGGGGIRMGEAGSGYPSHSRITIQSNLIYNAGIWGGQGDGIDIKGGIQYLKISGNEIRDLSPNGSLVRAIVLQGQEPGANQSTVIEKNRIHDCAHIEDAAIAVVNSWGVPQGVNIQNNEIYNITRANSTARPFGIKVYASQDDTQIFNNTVTNCAGAAIYADRPSQVSLVNNLFLDNNGGGAQVIIRSAIVESHHNAFNGVFGILPEGLGSLQLTFTDLLQIVQDPDTGDIHPTSSSIINGKGVVSKAFYDDLLNRIREVPWDLGAVTHY